MPIQGDLFAWADSQPVPELLDPYEIMLMRERRLKKRSRKDHVTLQTIYLQCSHAFIEVGTKRGPSLAPIVVTMAGYTEVQFSCRGALFSFVETELDYFALASAGEFLPYVTEEEFWTMYYFAQILPRALRAGLSKTYRHRQLAFYFGSFALRREKAILVRMTRAFCEYEWRGQLITCSTEESALPCIYTEGELSLPDELLNNLPQLSVHLWRAIPPPQDAEANRAAKKIARAVSVTLFDASEAPPVAPPRKQKVRPKPSPMLPQPSLFTSGS